jgi:hypothetical protein
VSGEAQGHLSFSVARTALRGRVLIPKYYDPEIVAAEALAETDFALPRLAACRLCVSADGWKVESWRLTPAAVPHPVLWTRGCTMRRA